MNPNLEGEDFPPIFEVDPAIGLTWHYVTTVIGILLFAWTIYFVFVKRDATPLMMFLGGLVLSLNDPLYNHLFHIRYAENFPGPAFVGFGIATPGFMPLGYAGFSVIGYFIYRAFRRGVTMRQVFLLWAAIFFMDVVFEGIPAALGSFTFDGRQPFEFANWGYYLGWMNATGFMAMGALLLFMVPRLHGWRKLLLLTVPMVGHIASVFCIAWPLFLALNWDVTPPIAWALGLLSLSFSLVFTWSIACVVARNPDKASRANPATVDTETQDSADPEPIALR